MALPTAFQQQMQEQLGAEYPDFIAALQQPPPTSIRINPYKNNKLTLAADVQPVAWCNQAYYLPERPVFTLDPAFHAGAYYVQEASSMVILAALQQWLGERTQPLKILDLCAAPGGKSTLLTHLGKEHLLVSNEVIKSRYTILQENLQRWGSTNKIITNHDVEDFAPLAGFFDVVVVDAPCSGEGLFRKDSNASQHWSPTAVSQCSSRQKRILAGAQALVKPNGILLYCTCTYNQKENLENVEWLHNEFAWTNLSCDLPNKWGISTITYKNSRGYQCYPHRTQGEGFFFSGFRKNGGQVFKEKKNQKNNQTTIVKLSRKETIATTNIITQHTDLQLFTNYKQQIAAISKYWWETAQIITNYLRKYEVGITIGEVKKKDMIAHHELALAADIIPLLPQLSVDRQAALHFLKKESFNVDTPAKGWQIIDYQGHRLGLVKVLPRRINNYLPKNWRIRMNIEV